MILAVEFLGEQHRQCHVVRAIQIAYGVIARIVAVEDVEIIEDRRRLVLPGGRRHHISRSRDGIEPAAFELEFVALGVAADALEVVQDQDLRLGARLFAVIIGRGEAAETAAYDDEIGRATSELQSLMRISYAVFCLKKKK